MMWFLHNQIGHLWPRWFHSQSRQIDISTHLQIMLSRLHERESFMQICLKEIQFYSNGWSFTLGKTI
jgi:hypothetical protein